MEFTNSRVYVSHMIPQLGQLVLPAINDTTFGNHHHSNRLFLVETPGGSRSSLLNLYGAHNSFNKSWDDLPNITCTFSGGS